MELFLRILLLVLSLAGFVFGIVSNLGKKSPMFQKLVIAAVGCFMLGRLYELVNIIIAGEINRAFNIGMLAQIGGFMFIFSASYAQMDGLVDDKSSELIKYRLIALIAPITVAAIYVPILLTSLSVGEKLTTCVIFVFTALASYYNFKHLIIPDVAFGIIASIRGYSLVSLILCLFNALTLTFDKLGAEIVFVIFTVLLAVAYPCVVIAVERGTKKWTI